MICNEIAACVKNNNNTSCFEVWPNFDNEAFDNEAFDKAFDNNNLNEFCLFTLNEDGEPVILFEGIDTSEIDTAIENIVQSF